MIESNLSRAGRCWHEKIEIALNNSLQTCFNEKVEALNGIYKQTARQNCVGEHQPKWIILRQYF